MTKEAQIDYAANIAEAQGRLEASQTLLEELNERSSRVNDKIRNMNAAGAAYVEISSAKGERDFVTKFLGLLREEVQDATRDLAEAHTASHNRPSIVGT